MGFLQVLESKVEHDGLNFVSYINITTTNSGYVKCVANNSLGEDEHIVTYLVTG